LLTLDTIYVLAPETLEVVWQADNINIITEFNEQQTSQSRIVLQANVFDKKKGASVSRKEMAFTQYEEFKEC
jgi:hypothetical protein